MHFLLALFIGIFLFFYYICINNIIELNNPLKHNVMNFYRLKKHALTPIFAILAVYTSLTACNQTTTTPQNGLRLEEETVIGNALNHYDSYEAYVNAGTTQSMKNGKFRPKEIADSVGSFVIYGVDLQSPEFKNGDFIWMGLLPQSDHSDYDYDGFTLPISGAVIAPRKSTIKLLSPNTKYYFIDGIEASSTQFEELPQQEIQCVTIKGDTLLIKKRFYPEPDAGNADVDKAQDDEGHLMRRMFTAEDKTRYDASQRK